MSAERHSRLAVMALVAMLSAPAVRAQTVSGIGARECRALSFALEKESDAAVDAYVAWAQGFISGFNWSNVRRQDVRIDAVAILDVMARYCAANPGHHVHAAVRELIRLNAR